MLHLPFLTSPVREGRAQARIRAAHFASATFAASIDLRIEDIASTARQRGASHSSSYGPSQVIPLPLSVYALAGLKDTFNLSLTGS
jgi:hypothetical protein